MIKENRILRKAKNRSLTLFSICTLSICAVPFGTVSTADTPSGSTSLLQQNMRKVTVSVVDDANEPIIGASALVTETKSGGSTDINGQCVVDTPAGSQIQVSYIGCQTQTVNIGQSSTLRVVLIKDRQMLDDVVVVGYDMMEKSDVTGFIAVAKGEKLTKSQNFSALDNLRGKASGVNVFSSSEDTATPKPRVIIRDMTTINASSDPLYVVDGVVVSGSALVNPNDIESVEVLKDASATIIYGVRGANGVIMVTTKRGLKGDTGTKISYQGSVSMRSIAHRMDLLNAQEWTDAWMRGLENENTYNGKKWSPNRTDQFTGRSYFDANGNPLYDTDWQDEATRTTVSYSHQMNIQQAGAKSSMGTFLNYSDYQGIMNNTWNKRVSAKMACDANPTNWLTTGVSPLVNHMWGCFTDTCGGGQEARRTMIEMLPWLLLREPDTGNYITATSPKMDYGFEGISNPAMILEQQKRMYYNTQTFGSAALTSHLSPNLGLKIQLGIDRYGIDYCCYATTTLNNISAPNSRAEHSHYNNLYWQEETYLTHNKTVDRHHFNGMLGLSWTGYTSRANGTTTEGFTDGFFEDNNTDVGANPKPPRSNIDEWAMNSYFLRLAYTYMGRYSATVTGCYDGSSKLGENNRYASFPSAGLAWIASEEDFLKNVTAVDNLKLHTSYGLTGNSEIGTYRSLARTNAGTLLLNGSRSSCYRLSSMANTELKWEKTAQSDTGFELGLFNDALNLDLSWYTRRTTNLLLDCPVPHFTSFSSIYKNIGSVKNSGLDIMISAYPVRTNDFTWQATLNANYNKNKILYLGDNDEDIELIYRVDGSESILRVSESMGSLYGYRRYGATTKEMQKNVVWTAEDFNNNLYSKDAVGKKRYSVEQIGRSNRPAKKKILGKGFPNWAGSWINNLKYRNWDFTMDWQFVAGVETMQQFSYSTYDRFGLTNGLKDILYGAYDGTNPETMQQMTRMANNGHAGQDTTTDSAWITDGSYLRLNMLQLGYTFSKEACGKLGTDALRLYVNGQNLWLLCSKGFKGYDPEAISQGNHFGQNMTFFSCPGARAFTLGMNVTFQLNNTQGKVEI